jgi:hypothetical protein
MGHPWAINTSNFELLATLKKNYPSLFSKEFDLFICNVKETMEYLNIKYGESFDINMQHYEYH